MTAHERAELDYFLGPDIDIEMKRPPIEECAFCQLPIPPESDSAPYCDKACENADIDMAILKDKIARGEPSCSCHK